MKQGSTGNTNKRQRIWDKSGGKCWYCGCDLDPYNWHKDHFLPRFRNENKKRLDYLRLNGGAGTDAESNLVPSCPSCNLQKATYTIEEFRHHIQSQFRVIASRSTFKLAERYGIVTRHEKRVVFWFESEARDDS